MQFSIVNFVDDICHNLKRSNTGPGEVAQSVKCLLDDIKT